MVQLGKGQTLTSTETNALAVPTRMVESQITSASAEITAISWTGGKDCNLALLAAWREPSLRVTCLVCFRPEDTTKFRAHPVAFMEAQAEALGLPLVHVIIPSDTTDYKGAYVTGMRRLRTEHGIVVWVTGDMDLVGTMKRNWIEECGEEAGIKAFLPLWKADREACLQKILVERFEVIFSCVKSPWFDGSWIGRKIDDETFAIMKEKSNCESTESGDKPLDLGGERGEYHSMCLNGPLYRKLVAVTILDIPIELTDQAGQKDGQRWWTISFQQNKAMHF